LDHSLSILGNICTEKPYAVKSMILGSIPILIATLYDSLKKNE